MEAKDIVQSLIDKGRTQSQIAEKVGVQQSTISKLMNGSIADISSKTYRALLELNRNTRKQPAKAV